MTTPCTCARTAIGGYSGSTRSTSAGAFSSPPMRTGPRATGGAAGGGGGGGGGGRSLISPPITPPTTPPGTPPSTPPGTPSVLPVSTDVSSTISRGASTGAARRFAVGTCAIAFGFDGVAAGAGGGGGGGGAGNGAVDTTNATMSGTRGSSALTYRIDIATTAPPTTTCAAVEMSTGTLLRCGAR